MKRIMIVVLGLLLVCQLPLQAKKRDHGQNKDRKVQQHTQQQKQEKHSKYRQEEQETRLHSDQSDRRSKEKEWRKSGRGVRINNEEKRVFDRYCQELDLQSRRGYPWYLPPGLAKKVSRGGELPPGWQNKLAVGQVMPDEVYYRTRYVPVHIIEYLPPQPEGTTLVVISGKVVRLLEATRTIMDVFDLRLN